MVSFFARALPDRRRAFSLALAIALELLFIAALLLIGGYRPTALTNTTATTLIDVAPEAKPKARSIASAVRATQPPPPPRKERVEATTPPVKLTPTAPGFVVLTPEDYAASDIGKLPNRRGEAGASGAQSADGKGNGEAPGGGNLYNAEWVREPSDAELALYLPKRRTTGWAMVACRTAPRNRVEDCRHLGESPGSGLAGTLRQASWQFLVRPPRLDGKPLIGAWVRIRFDFTVRGAGETDENF